MAKDDKPKDLIGYDGLQQEALRSVVRGALDRAATPRGLPGDHHFYLSFRTDFPGVVMPEELVTRYPEEMTIVLQNQFWDLSPGETSFSVTLQFAGQPKSLTIPYVAMTRFYDPSVQYLLQFTPGTPPRRAAAPPPSAPAPVAADAGEDGPKVVSLDQFRKK
ncbi:MAG TPA: ClpXP protease specificity-enhancing factor SspB [Caulobacteraceae bacterium]|jgi:hypothetical protein